MNWVKAYAYKSSEFVLEQLLKQVRVEIEEANALPSIARKGFRFKLTAEGGKSGSVTRSSAQQLEIAVVRFGIMRDSNAVWARREESRSPPITYKLSAQWDENSELEVWTIEENGNMESGLFVTDITRKILEPAMFTG